MRILLMADTPENPDSGAAGTEFQTAQALRSRGHRVDTVWADALPHRISHGNLHYLLELPFAYRRQMLKHLARARYDVVHVNQPHGYLAAAALRRVPEAPVFVHRSHGFEPRAARVLRPWLQRYSRPDARPVRAIRSLMASLLEFNNRHIASNADGHIVSSSLCADFLKNEYDVEPCRVAVIPQAPPDTYRATPAPVARPDRHRLLYVGQYAFFKAPMVLASAFEAILTRHEQATLTWVCDKRHHEQARGLFSERAQSRLSLVDWMGQDQLRDTIDAHGIFLFPSFFEGFGKAFVEAMSRGLPVIASNEGGAVDLIVDGVNGRLVPPGDAAAIAAAADELLADPSLAAAIGERARDAALQLSWARVAVETEDFYGRLIASPRRGVGRS